MASFWDRANDSLEAFVFVFHDDVLRHRYLTVFGTLSRWPRPETGRFDYLRKARPELPYSRL